MNKGIKKMRFKRFLYTAIIIMLVLATFIAVPACSKNDEETPQTAIASEETGSSASQTTKTEQPDTSTTEEATTTTGQKLPENLQKYIDVADKLFADGEFAQAVSAYRTAKATLQAASINLDVINEAIEKLEVNFDKAKSITDAARIHFGNAMQLEYEKRIDEAIEQLEEALKIYPKYQDAIDALESIKTLYNLK